MDQTRHTISPTELMSHIGTHRAPCLIDVCLPQDVAADPWRLPGACHVPHRQVLDWASDQAPTQPIVAICQKGLKLSHGAAAALRSLGFDARALVGGNLAWCAADHPRLALDTAPPAGTIWVVPATQDRRAALCAWVIRRWYDPGARVFWVAEDHVSDVATRFEAHAVPFDTTLSDAFAQRGLIHARLHAFLAATQNGMAPGTALIDVLPDLYITDESLAQAALPILDAAWMAFRHSDAQEAA